MNYIVSDIHNDNRRFEKLLDKLQLGEGDALYILGDLFDRADYNPDPVGVYFNVLKLGNKCKVIRGNHDQELAEYILKYQSAVEKKCLEFPRYKYNSFELLASRLTPVDMFEVATEILRWPLQVELNLNDNKYLLAHAMTGMPVNSYEQDHFLVGSKDVNKFMDEGIDGYISICGHTNIGGSSIWKNEKGNVIICDCGCGIGGGRLGCLCLETGEEIYID